MTEADLFAALHATWPAADITRITDAEAQPAAPARQTKPAAPARQTAEVTLRDGAGGGKRASAATVCGRLTPELRSQAEAAMRARGQAPLWMVPDSDPELDAQLAAAGYDKVDPSLFMTAPPEALATQDLPPVSALRAWPPLGMQGEIWSACHIGPARLAVMHRVSGPKQAWLGRVDNAPGGCAFVALHEGIAMVHALAVLPQRRRKGLARWLMIDAARWAQEQGAQSLALAVTAQNTGARAFYEALGFRARPGYGYRIMEEPA